MIESSRIADSETRKRSIAKLRESNRQLELVTLALDELIAMVETDLCRQRRERLQRTKRSSSEEVKR
jgi:hypothetical protein